MHASIQYRLMSFLICGKHEKREKQASKVGVTAHVCMNRYCPNSFQVFCAACKNDHRDHAVKVLTLEDLSFLLERLLKAPFHDVTRYVSETVQVMKKLKLIKEFRKKIDILEKEVQKDALRLVDYTEGLVHEYALCSRTAAQAMELLSKESPEQYALFVEGSTSMLGNLEYNAKKDRLQLGNATIKQRQDKRRKALQAGKRKIEEVRDYSMKIIQVILHNDDSEEDEQDLQFKQKHYELLKTELSLDKDEQQLDEEISDLKNSGSTANRSRIRRRETQEEETRITQRMESKTQTSERIVEEREGEREREKEERKEISEGGSQTECEVVGREEAATELQRQLSEMRHYHMRLQNDLRLKLSVIAKQKENLNREVGKWKERCEEKKRSMRAIESSLRENKLQRSERGKLREDVMQRIIELWQGRGAQEEREEV